MEQHNIDGNKTLTHLKEVVPLPKEKDIFDVVRDDLFLNEVNFCGLFEKFKQLTDVRQDSILSSIPITEFKALVDTFERVKSYRIDELAAESERVKEIHSIFSIMQEKNISIDELSLFSKRDSKLVAAKWKQAIDDYTSEYKLEPLKLDNLNLSTMELAFYELLKTIADDQGRINLNPSQALYLLGYKNQNEISRLAYRLRKKGLLTGRFKQKNVVVNLLVDE